MGIDQLVLSPFPEEVVAQCGQLVACDFHMTQVVASDKCTILYGGQPFGLYQCAAQASAAAEGALSDHFQSLGQGDA